MQKLFFILLSLLLFHPLSSQTSECGTQVSDEWYQYLLDYQQKKRQGDIQLMNADEIIYFPICHHIVRQSNGTGGLATSSLDVIMDELNAKYKNAGIQFYTSKIDVINNTTYYNFSHSQENTVRSNYNDSKSINIYYCNSVKLSDSSTAAGYSYTPDANRNFTVIANEYALNGSTVLHEVGHAFGLLHTHDTRNGVEHPNGSNCSDTGDLCCDTPADPELSSSNVKNCQYIGNASLDGVPYRPDVYNYMSYAPKTCRTRFSNDQLSMVKYNSRDKSLYLYALSKQEPEYVIQTAVSLSSGKVMDYVVIRIIEGGTLTNNGGTINAGKLIIENKGALANSSGTINCSTIENHQGGTFTNQQGALLNSKP